MAFTYAGRYSPEAFVDPYGQPLRNTTVTVYQAGTTTLATLYEDRGKDNSIPNPTATDARGNCSFYAEPGYYDLLINGVTIQNVSIEADPADIESRASGSEVIARSVLNDKGSILIASGPESPASFDPTGAADGEALVVSSSSPTGWTTAVVASEAGPHDHAESDVTGLLTDLAGLATADTDLAAADAAHAADSTAVHGITDTAELVTNSNFATGTPTGSKYLRDDRSWQPVSGGGSTIAQQDTAPSSPATNDLWIDTDAAPAAASVAFLGAEARRAADHNLSATAWTYLSFDTEVRDTDNCFTTASGDRFTINTAGRYIIHVQIEWASTLGDKYLSIGASSTIGAAPGTEKMRVSKAAAGANHNMDATMELDLAVGDKVYFAAYNGYGGSSITVWGSTAVAYSYRAWIRRVSD